MNKIICGDSLEVLKTLESGSVDCCVTSPPYWALRDYGVEGQLGLEKTPEEYVSKMVEVFREVKRVLKKEGTLWLNLGSSYASKPPGNPGAMQSHSRKDDVGGIEIIKECSGHQGIPIGWKEKDLIPTPWLVALALRADGWYLRQDIIWHKPNPMPESVTDRCTKSHEYVFLLSKSAKYYFDNEAIKEPYTENSDMEYRKTLRCGRKYGVKRPYEDNQPLSYQNKPTDTTNGRNKRSVWTVTTKPYSGAHFATFPEELIIPMIKAGCPKGGIVLDPFSGAGTTCMVAKKLERNYLGIELNPKYIQLAENRIEQECGTLF